MCGVAGGIFGFFPSRATRIAYLCRVALNKNGLSIVAFLRESGIAESRGTASAIVLITVSLFYLWGFLYECDLRSITASVVVAVVERSQDMNVSTPPDFKRQNGNSYRPEAIPPYPFLRGITKLKDMSLMSPAEALLGRLRGNRSHFRLPVLASTRSFTMAMVRASRKPRDHPQAVKLSIAWQDHGEGG